MSIVKFFKEKVLGQFFSKDELPPEDDQTFDVPEVSDEDVEIWLEDEPEQADDELYALKK